MDDEFTMVAPKRDSAHKDSAWIPIVVGVILVAAIGIWIYSAFFGDNAVDEGAERIELPWEETEKAPFADRQQSGRKEETRPLSKEPIKSIRKWSKAEDNLPDLDTSDDLTRRVAVDISSHASWPIWLIPNQLIRKFTMLVDNLSRGSVPRKQFLHLAPKGRFKARTRNGEYTINPESYRRYNTFADVVGSVNTKKLLSAYQKLSPLLQKAYAELGYPDISFDDVLNAAIQKILETPSPKGDIKLVRPAVVYKFADPKLESLKPAQKQLLRMGPRNIGIIRPKLEEISNSLNDMRTE